ncbi:hypothetical protein HELRODRAFT_160926 [Helobdella robusta]|uniref:Uncharacterized protein n=1 Tax=Helobdella robusta TaxID=6412 RepID=T1EQV2_HELRO|nr:hypothetical protein HELRODRAFT_160926 [Helobdella robusta]ESO01766.1 hypothetical protein HELRODRAFT_160926 [Helobdella robusta]
MKLVKEDPTAALSFLSKTDDDIEYDTITDPMRTSINESDTTEGDFVSETGVIGVAPICSGTDTTVSAGVAELQEKEGMQMNSFKELIASTSSVVPALLSDVSTDCTVTVAATNCVSSASAVLTTSSTSDGSNNNQMSKGLYYI